MAPFLIILRVANRSALANETIDSGTTVVSIDFNSKEKLASENTSLSGGDPATLVDTDVESRSEFGTEVESSIDDVDTKSE